LGFKSIDTSRNGKCRGLRRLSVGKYEIKPGFVITILKNGNQLKARATGQPEALIFPKSENGFYLKVVEAQLTFNKNNERNRKRDITP
jgi:hypothetical protein